jgi:hypothetical protein
MVSAAGSILMLDPGAGWIQVAGRGVRSERFYGAGGGVHDLPGGTEATTTSAFVTGAVGLVHGMELWGQLPIHRLRVADNAQTRTRTSLGDVRVSVRFGPEIFGIHALPVSVRAGLKLPGTDFPVDPRVLPLSEGQTDYELAVESGATLSERGLYFVAWAGYRWRTLDEDTGREPGDERFAHVAFGRSLGPVRFELGLDGLDGLSPVDNRVRIPASARQLVQISPSVAWAAGAGRFEVGAQIPVSGRNLPTGPALSFGYLLAWGGM